MFFGFNMLQGMGQNSQLYMLMEGSKAQHKNMQMLMDMFNRWSNIAVSRLKWVGLPDTVDKRVLNMGLYLAGNVAFFEHDELGLIALPCTPGDRFNLLYQPISVTAWGYGYSTQLTNGISIDDPTAEPKDKFAMVRFTPTGMPVAMSVFNLVYRMSDILRSIDVVAQRMKRPYIILCEEKERLTIDNLFKQIKDNEELILGSKGYGLKDTAIEIAPTPSVGDLNALWATYKDYETMLYTMMGIDNVGYGKKERMITDEVNANNMVVRMADAVNLKELELGLSRVNTVFGTNISVEIDKTEDNFNGEIYDNP